MHNSIVLFNLAIISVASFLIPVLTKEFNFIKMPEVVIEILLGLFLGSSGLNIIKNDIITEFLSLFGLSLLMFLTGLEIDFSILTKNHGKDAYHNPAFIGFSFFTLSFCMSCIMSLLFCRYIKINPLLLSIIFSSVSVAIVLPVLKEKKILTDTTGQTILITASLCEFITMTLMTIIISLLSDKDIFRIINYAVIIFISVLISIICKYFSKTYEKKLYNNKLFLRLAIAFFLIYITISEAIDIEIAIGAFLAGLIFSYIFNDIKRNLLHDLENIGYNFFIPIFFVLVGSNLNLSYIHHYDICFILPLYILIAYTSKIVPSLLLKKYLGKKNALAVGVLLTSNLSLIIIISLLAFNEGIISLSGYSTLILLSVILCILSPMVFFSAYKED